MNIASTIVAVAETTVPAGEVRVGLGTVVLTVAVVGLLVWTGYLVLNARRTRTPRPEPTPANLQPYLSDDQLENNRLTRVLGAAVISAAVLAITLPIYYANESNRQASAAEAFDELYVEEGEKWWTNFSCFSCHGPEAGGGGAAFTEARSGVAISWSAPALDDIFFRFSPEEIETIIVYGRQGTPMPANGIAGGGAMTEQEVEQVMAFIEHLQIGQAEVLARADGRVDLALARIAGGETTVRDLIAAQEAAREDVLAAPERFGVIENFPTEIEALLSGNGTCTDESAELVSLACDVPGQDTDRDGLTDDAERRLSEIAAAMYQTAVGRNLSTLEVFNKPVYDIDFRTDDAFTNSSATGAPIADLEEADTFITSLGTDHLTLSVQTARQDTFLAGIDGRLGYLRDALEAQAWEIDFEALAQAMTRQSAADSAAAAAEGEQLASRFFSVADAERAVGLFNAYCARCHTAGYSAGVAFEQAHGSGAWGPSLRDGRSLVQFPQFEDQVNFVIRGTNFGEVFGVNGLGSGRMPSFGQSLTLEDIELIVAFERSLG